VRPSADGTAIGSVIKPRRIAFCVLSTLMVKYIYHKKCVPRSYWDTVFYGNQLSELPVCRALNAMGWSEETWAQLSKWAQSLV
jgi:hypothetical protein